MTLEAGPKAGLVTVLNLAVPALSADRGLPRVVPLGGQGCLPSATPWTDSPGPPLSCLRSAAVSETKLGRWPAGMVRQLLSRATLAGTRVFRRFY